MTFMLSISSKNFSKVVERPKYQMRNLIDLASERRLAEEVAASLDEYQTIPAYNPPPLPASAFTIVDTIVTNIGALSVGELSHGGESAYALLDENVVHATLVFQLLSGPYVILHQAVAYTPKKGLATSLFRWFKQCHNKGVFSDAQMTPQGEAFWMSLMKAYPSKVVNLSSQETYELSDMGKTINGVRVLDPKTDNAAPDLMFYSPTGQRWAYLIEYRAPDQSLPLRPLKERYVKGSGLGTVAAWGWLRLLHCRVVEGVD